jgi:photosystem II stability/assembly factor-like uncharacterized protein
MQLFQPIRALAATALAACLLVAPTYRAAADFYDDLLAKPDWRNVGPAIMGGRINDVAVVEKSPSTLYFAHASGGLFKSINAGTTWTPVFETHETSSVGDVDICQDKPDVVYIGTGEANNRQSSTWGDGVYKSTDGGKTWANVGLKDTRHIARVIVHPTNPDIVWVAAMGKLWGANKERGVYKTTDGGKTWKQTLFVNETTGATDVAIDPSDPNVLYAATYQRQRAPFGFAGGGVNSGLYKSVDGGETWKKLSNGLPTGDVGRIGIGIYRKNPKVVYSIWETKNGSISGTNNGSIFRSEDGGENWTKVSDVNPRPMYYSQIHIDPNDDKNIWVLGASMYNSTDGGKTFTSQRVDRIHGDYHALWINPANSNHVFAGSDGGAHWTHDGGRTWDFVNTLALAQFYEIAYDFRKPYYVYGGLQDNGSWAAPSRTPYSVGVLNDDWYRIGGGDGFYCQVSPKDWRILYTESQNGAAGRLNQATGERKSITPRRQPGDEEYRFDWNTPLHISPHDSNKIYMAGNRLFISTDRGDSWRKTEDLTTKPDRTKMPIMGALVTSKTLSANDGTDSYGQIVTMSESPLVPGLLYVGTDDGNLQVSRDDGKTWTNLTGKVPGVPKGTWVSRVAPSAHVAGRVYVTFDGHRSDDFAPYVFVSEDYGQSWQRITTGVPEFHVARGFKEHHRNPNLLFLGTERGLYVSFNRGASWKRMKDNLPTVPINDVQIHPRDNDLILGTHGRGIYILDDIGYLEDAEKSQSYDAYLCTPKPAIDWKISLRKGSTGHKIFEAQNPQRGAVLWFYLKNEPKEDTPVTITILEKDGKTVVRDLAVSRLRSGLNSVTWDFRYNSPTADLPAEGTQPAAQNAPNTPRRNVGFGANGVKVLPGTYLVKLKMGGTEMIKPIQVEDDPRLELTTAERKTYFNAQKQAAVTYRNMEQARRALLALRTQLTRLQESDGMKKADKAIVDEVKALAQEVETLSGMVTPRTQPARRTAEAESGTQSEAPAAPRPANDVQPLSPRVSRAMFSLEGLVEVPSKATMDEIRSVTAEVNRLVGQVNALSARRIPDINRKLKSAKLDEIKTGGRITLVPPRQTEPRIGVRSEEVTQTETLMEGEYGEEADGRH